MAGRARSYLATDQRHIRCARAWPILAKHVRSRSQDRAPWRALAACDESVRPRPSAEAASKAQRVNRQAPRPSEDRSCSDRAPQRRDRDKRSRFAIDAIGTAVETDTARAAWEVDCRRRRIVGDDNDRPANRAATTTADAAPSSI